MRGVASLDGDMGGGCVFGVVAHSLNILWMDGIQLAPPNKPWNDSIPL